MDTRVVVIRVSPGPPENRSQFQVQLETEQGTKTAYFELAHVQRMEAFPTGATSEELKRSGQALFGLLLPPPELLALWQAERRFVANARSQVVFQFLAGTDDIGSLPLSLLHDEQGFLFRKPTIGWQVEYCDLPEALPQPPPGRRRVLVAWARPDGVPKFDPLRHLQGIRSIGDLDAEPLENATVGSLSSRISGAAQEGRPFDSVHLLAHGGPGRVFLEKHGFRPDPLDGQALGAALRGCRFVFLNVCSSAREPPNTLSLARHLLHHDGGNCAAVVACQGDMPQGNWEEQFVREFYANLHSTNDPATALAAARSKASEQAWHIPVLLTRRTRPTPRAELAARSAGVASHRSAAADSKELGHAHAAVRLLESDAVFRRSLAAKLGLDASEESELVTALRSIEEKTLETVGLVAEQLVLERCESGSRREAEALFNGYCALLPQYFTQPDLSSDASGLIDLRSCHYPFEIEAVLARLYGRSPRFRRGDETDRILGDRAFEYLAPDAPETGSLPRDIADDAALAMNLELGNDLFERQEARIAEELPKEMRPDDRTLKEFCERQRRAGRPFHAIVHAAPSCPPRWNVALKIAELLQLRFGKGLATYAPTAPDQSVARIVLFTLSAMLKALSTR